MHILCLSNFKILSDVNLILKIFTSADPAVYVRAGGQEYHSDARHSVEEAESDHRGSVQTQRSRAGRW